MTVAYLGDDREMTRREFLAASAALPAAVAAPPPKASIAVGITVDTRPDWNGPENFIRSIDEVSSAGYHRIETFWNYVERWQDNPRGLADELTKRNLKLETVSNGGRMHTDFVDPSQRTAVIEDHMKLVRFIQLVSVRPPEDQYRRQTWPRRSNRRLQRNGEDL